MKYSLSFLGLFVVISSYAQVTFEKGYFIDNSDKKIDCLIKNVDKVKNPMEFEYKFSEDDVVQKTSIQDIKEFGIYDYSKYVRKEVNIDRSSENISYLSSDKNPTFNKEQIFLKVLIEGKANFYVFEEDGMRRFFFSKEGVPVEQLIFKKYRTSTSSVAENNEFRKQIWNELQCPESKIDKFQKLSYRKNILIGIFEEYNKCHNSDYVNYDEKRTKTIFTLSIRPRLNRSSLITRSVNDSQGSDFGNKSTFGIGLEGELTLPFNRNKWAIIVEPTYQRFSAREESEVNGVGGMSTVFYDVNYRSIEVPLGLRHYFFLNNRSKIFINVLGIIDFGGKSVIDNKREDNSNISAMDIKASPNFAFGLGYKYNRFSAELRYQTPREILRDYMYWSSDYKTLSLIVGFSLF